LRNPIEYCTGQPANGLPSNYAGHYVGRNISNEQNNVQDQGRNQTAEEGSSRLYNVVMDNEGQEIDLNVPYNYDDGIVENQSQDQNTGKK